MTLAPPLGTAFEQRLSRRVRAASPDGGRMNLLYCLIAGVGMGNALIFNFARAAEGGPTPAAYERALHLRDQWVDLTRDVADAAEWTQAGDAFYYRKSVEGGFQFVTVSWPSLKRAPSFNQASVTGGLSQATGVHYDPLNLPFNTFDFVDDGKAIAFKFDDKEWRCTLVDSTCALSVSSLQPRIVGSTRDLTAPADNHLRPSPDGRWDAFVRYNNVFVRQRISGKEHPLSVDGVPSYFYDPQSIVWSPDSKRIAAYRVEPGVQRLVHYIDGAPADQLQAKLVTRLYPKPGDAIDHDRPVILDVSTRQAILVDDQLFPNPIGSSPLIWSEDSKTVSFTYVQRGYHMARAIGIDAENGHARVMVDEQGQPFINAARLYRHDVKGTTGEIIWASDRDGWRHLYLFDGRSGKLRNQITKGDWVVRDVVKVDDDHRKIWFIASGMHAGEDPYLKYFFSVNFDGSGLKALTTERGSHDVALSPDEKYFVDTYSLIDVPPASQLRNASDGSLITTLERGDMTRLLQAGWRPPEEFSAKGRDGKTDIWGMIVRPTNFDPKAKYPVIEQIYAGPHRIAVPKTFWPFGIKWGGDKEIGLQALADLGFVVVMIDGMGTSYRSRAFEHMAWKNLEDAGLPDRIAWHKAVAAQYSWYDVSRVGIYGVSDGGQNVLWAMINYPDFYKVGIAFNGNYDNRIQELGWTEQWMGWPLDGAYPRSSVAANVRRLKGKLMLISGRMDTNVEPTETDRLVQALIDADKSFDFLPLPRGDHSDGHYTGPVDYVIRRQYDFFVRNLAGQPTPDWNKVLTDAKDTAP
jgi:dipeptidyl aminopeptidase/acylaminoacyl peptidase